VISDISMMISKG